MAERRFDENATTRDVMSGIDLSGKTALVTGCSSGLGAETARALAAAGASVTITGRNEAKTESVAKRLREETGNAEIETLTLSLDDPSSVRAAVGRWLARHDRLHLLINNAGVMACPLARTAEGWEMQFATNHLGHFLLTGLLAAALEKGAPARIVNVSSGGHRFSDVDFEDPNFASRAYDKFVAYGQSKTANVLHAVELDRRLRGRGVRALAIHPGAIMTELGRHLTADDMSSFGGQLSFKTVEAGAATQVFAATAPELDDVGARYLEDCQLSGPEPPEGSLGCSDYALDQDSAKRLWSLSESLLGERFEVGDASA